MTAIISSFSIAGYAANHDWEVRQFLKSAGKNPDAECGEKRNCSSSARVKIKRIGISDDGSDFPGHVMDKEPNQKYHIHIKIENTALGDAKNVEIRYYLSRDKIFGDSDDEYLDSDWIDVLGSKEIHEDRKTKYSNNKPLYSPKNLGEYYIYAIVIESGQQYISNDQDKGEYANLTVKEYAPSSASRGDVWRAGVDYTDQQKNKEQQIKDEAKMRAQKQALKEQREKDEEKARTAAKLAKEQKEQEEEKERAARKAAKEKKEKEEEKQRAEKNRLKKEKEKAEEKARAEKEKKEKEKKKKKK